MKTFENKVLHFEINSKRSYGEMDDLLNRYGAEGWEVVSAMVNGDGFTAFLKREGTSAPSKENAA